jgi:hypothetical protein
MAPRTPTEHHYDLAESGLADLGRVGFDDPGRTVEVLVALTHASWRSPRSSPLRTTTADRRTIQKRPVPVDPRGALPVAFRPGRRVSHRSMVKRANGAGRL